jgi:hypothetical protein
MSEPSDDIVKIADGPLVQIELWQQVLKEAGIDSRVVGTDLSGSFGSALPGSVELWVHESDRAKAEAAIQLAESERGRPAATRPPHGIPESDRPSPGSGQHFPGGAKFNTGERGH